MTLRCTTTKVVGVLALLAAIVTPALAGTVASDSATLTGEGRIQAVDVNSVVSYDAGVYTYLYTLYYRSGSVTIHQFSVENVDNVAFGTAANVPVGNISAASHAFTNPAYVQEDWAGEVLWFDGAYNPGETWQFSYTSSAAPMADVRVYTYVVNGGNTAGGEAAIGMGSMAPEPDSIMALAVGIGSIAPFVLRRRK